MWSDIIFLLFLLYSSNGQIEQASIAEQREKLMGGKKTLIGGKKLLALHAKKPVIDLTADRKSSHRWPNGQVNYYIDENSYDKTIAIKLEAAFATLASSVACPEFKLLSDKPVGDGGSWLHFTNPDRVRPCVHEPGGTGSSEQGEIVVVLGYDCLKPREIVHTVMHGLGFHDEVTHPQRDLFIKVMWNDIQPVFRSMFRIRSMREPGINIVLDYDPKSIMHFHDHAYTLTGKPSIAPLLPGLNIDPSKELSHIDKIKMRLLFAHECKKRQINKIIHSCANKDGNNNDGNNGGGGNDNILIPGNDVTNVMPDYGDHSDKNAASGDGNEIVVPGNDVTAIDSDPNPQGDKSEAGNDNDAGNDVAGGDDAGDVDGSDNGSIVVPGNDVSTIHEINSKEGLVVEGDNVKITVESRGSPEKNDVGSGSGGTGDSQGSQDVDGNDSRSDGRNTLMGDKSQVPVEEGDVTSDA